jgi:hypothetical protein
MNNQQKIAFLLDFDGPLFNNDEVKTRLLQLYNISESEWNDVYNASRRGVLYVDYGKIISILSEQSTANKEMIWEYLSKVMKREEFCSKENRQALVEFAQMGHIELVTQGEEEYQWKKLLASGVQDIIDQENASKGEGPLKHSIRVIEENKSVHLRARLKGLWEDKYTVIQIDDRVDPLLDLQQFAEQQGISRDMFQQYRIKTGKYGEIKSPSECSWQDFSTTLGVSNYIRDNYVNNRNSEGHYRTPGTMK